MDNKIILSHDLSDIFLERVKKGNSYEQYNIQIKAKHNRKLCRIFMTGIVNYIGSKSYTNRNGYIYFGKEDSIFFNNISEQILLKPGDKIKFNIV